MILQPYGPIEEAIQKSNAPITPSLKNTYIFRGVLATLLVGGLIYFIIRANKTKGERNEYQSSEVN